jgi:probable F420-dependent oxidoreductase
MARRVGQNRHRTGLAGETEPAMTTQSPTSLGRLGVWVSRGAHAPGSWGPIATLAERLGFGCLWISGGAADGVFDAVTEALAATSRIPVATGVVNLWFETPESVTSAWQRIEAVHPGRLFVGLGISHAPLVTSVDKGPFDRPLARTKAFLDDLDAIDNSVPPERRVLAALGPKMLALAKERTLGTHPYLVTPEHTRLARAELGVGPLLAPEQTVVLDSDLTRGREQARAFLSRYLGFPNYTNNWLRAGFEPADLENGGSERLVQAMVPAGGLEVVSAAVQGHWDAGADHVCVQSLAADFTDLAGTWEVLAELV